MDTGIFVVLSVLVAVFAIGFYMDWFGLWATATERQEQIDRSKEQLLDLHKQGGDKILAAATKAKEDAVTEARWRDDGGQG